MASFDQQELRKVLGSFVTGVTVVTTLDPQGQPQGVTANSFSSVSLEPPLVLWSQALTARSFGAFRDGERFVINILAADQMAISRRFAQSGGDKFADVRWRPGIGGLPVIEGCIACLECRKVASHPGGDHLIYIGEVEHIERAERKPLAFAGGAYMLAHAHDLGSFAVDDAGSETPGRRHIDAVRIANAALPAIARRLDATVGLSVWGNRGPTVIHWEPSRHAVTEDLHTGLVVSPILSATGQSFSAHQPLDDVQPHIEAELAAMADAGMLGIPSREQIAQTLDEVRRQGLAHSVPDRFGPDIAAIAAPVFDHRGRIVLSLTVVDAEVRVGTGYQGPMQDLLREEAQKLSQKLGYRAG